MFCRFFHNFASYMAGADSMENNNSSTALAWLEEVRGHLSEGHVVEFSPKGHSMWPTLRPDCDTVSLEATGEYRLNDLVLALCDEPRGVFLHRIIRVRPDEVLLAGDSNLCQTERCRHENIVGKITAIRRNGRDVSASFTNRILTFLQNLPPLPRRMFVRTVRLYLKYHHQ